MTQKNNTKLKRIAAITMARNDTFFLSRWIEYYGKQFGKQNLYIYLDGTDQEIPKNADKANITKFEHIDQSRQHGDKSRILLLSNLAKKLFSAGYDIVIGCDCDEFLIIDPAINTPLAQYLSTTQIKTTLSGLGLDIGQNIRTESVLDEQLPFLSQREYALLSTRYTKPVVINKPVFWGSGFHSIKNHNFNIDKNLYLLHFGAVDLNMLTTKAAKRGPDWLNHLKRRGNGTINAVTNKKVRSTYWLNIARFIQTYTRPIYSWRKPAMFGIKIVVKIPARFKKSGV